MNLDNDLRVIWEFTIGIPITSNSKNKHKILKMMIIMIMMIMMKNISNNLNILYLKLQKN